MTDSERQETVEDSVLQDAPCGFLSFELDGKIHFANRTLCDWLGTTPELLRERHVESILTTASRIFYQTHLYPLVVLHGQTQEVFLTLKSVDGQEISVFVTAGRRERGGVQLIECAVMVFRERQRYEADLLDMKKRAELARREAEDSNRAKSVFLATLSHELRTPLNAIAGYTQLIALGMRGAVTAEQQADLARMRNSQQHLLKIINDVLTFAKLDAGHIEYEIGPVAVSELFERVEDLTALQFATYEVQCQVESSRLTVLADPDRARQILLNLLSNAAKFTEIGGTVTMRAEASGTDQIRILVSDTGMGMAPERIESAFAPFVQLDRSLSRPADGVGLGLSIGRDLARAMAGDLTATSEVGAGSTFVLTLPRGPRVV